jgi:serine/threonine protein kinase
MQIKKRVLNEKYELKKHHLSKISPEMADFLTRCLKLDKKDRLSATKISTHPVFIPAHKKVQNMMREVISISSSYESQLSKDTAKGKVTN